MKNVPLNNGQANEKRQMNNSNQGYYSRNQRGTTPQREKVFYKNKQFNTQFVLLDEKSSSFQSSQTNQFIQVSNQILNTRNNWHSQSSSMGNGGVNGTMQQAKLSKMRDQDMNTSSVFSQIGNQESQKSSIGVEYRQIKQQLHNEYVNQSLELSKKHHQNRRRLKHHSSKSLVSNSSIIKSSTSLKKEGLLENLGESNLNSEVLKLKQITNESSSKSPQLNLNESTIHPSLKNDELSPSRLKAPIQDLDNLLPEISLTKINPQPHQNRKQKPLAQRDIKAEPILNAEEVKANKKPNEVIVNVYQPINTRTIVLDKIATQNLSVNAQKRSHMRQSSLEHNLLKQSSNLLNEENYGILPVEFSQHKHLPELNKDNMFQQRESSYLSEIAQNQSKHIKRGGSIHESPHKHESLLEDEGMQSESADNSKNFQPTMSKNKPAGFRHNHSISQKRIDPASYNLVRFNSAQHIEPNLSLSQDTNSLQILLPLISHSKHASTDSPNPQPYSYPMHSQKSSLELKVSQQVLESYRRRVQEESSNEYTLESNSVQNGLISFGGNKLSEQSSLQAFAGGITQVVVGNANQIAKRPNAQSKSRQHHEKWLPQFNRRAGDRQELSASVMIVGRNSAVNYYQDDFVRQQIEAKNLQSFGQMVQRQGFKGNQSRNTRTESKGSLSQPLRESNIIVKSQHKVTPSNAINFQENGGKKQQEVSKKDQSV